MNARIGVLAFVLLSASCSSALGLDGLTKVDCIADCVVTKDSSRDASARSVEDRAAPPVANALVARKPSVDAAVAPEASVDAAEYDPLPADASAASYSIGGAVTGLSAGQQVTLRNNGGNDLMVGAGAFTFTTPVLNESSYAVTVAAQPPNGMCVVAQGSGRINAANVTNVAVTCIANMTFTNTNTGRTGTIQPWTVPYSGTYRIDAYGAQGGTGDSTVAGGRGARMQGNFVLTRGQVLQILVGQQGATTSATGGGGGGTFVVRSGTPLIVAGGGGGVRVGAAYGGKDASTGVNGVYGSVSPTSLANDNPGGTNGSGGASGQNYGSGGGGFSGDGANDGNFGTGGASFLNGGFGGDRGAVVCSGTAPAPAPGGFGGGGAGNGCGGDVGAGGGGGGYSGGGAGRIAGGGGSWNTGSSPANTITSRTGHGSVTIKFISP